MVLATDPVLSTNLTLLPRNGTSVHPWVRVTVAPCPPRSPRALCLSRESKAQALSSLLNASVTANSRSDNASVVVTVSLGTRPIAPRPVYTTREQDGQNATIHLLRDALMGNRMFRSVRDHTVSGVPGRMFVYVVFAPVVIQYSSPLAASEYTSMITCAAHDAFDDAFGIHRLPGPCMASPDYVYPDNIAL